ncbi:MAG: hypothetical protein Ta2F_06100 [Termitinemataceae bacterium]|nr:MAG: hypothetical protein Ta2F_06100 [Termitinemataceae bacterium]
MDEKKKYKVIIVLAIFISYALIAAEPVPQETVLQLQWIKSLESGYKSEITDIQAQDANYANTLIPFKLDNHFGYISEDGSFALNKTRQGYISINKDFFAEYSGTDNKIALKDSSGNTVFTIENKQAYPFFLDNRIFLMHKEQNAISELNKEGDVLWTFDFPSLISAADASGDFLLCGMIDGTVMLVDNKGKLVDSFSPSGSRVSVVYGCAISKDGTKAAVICGLDKQRFIFFEQLNSTWRITYHSFLDNGFRRPVFIQFADNDGRVVYERENAIDIYEIQTRKSYTIPLDYKIEHIQGGSPLLFLATEKKGADKMLVGMTYPQTVFMKAPFTSEKSFIAFNGRHLVIGGQSKLASFEIVKR